MGKKYLTIANILCIMFKGDIMSKILIISEEFFNRENANTHCLEELIGGLKKNGHEIYLLTKEYGCDTLSDIDDAEIYKFRMNLQMFADSRSAMRNKNVILRTVFMIMSYILYHLDTSLLISKMVKKGTQLIKEKKIDKVISIFQTSVNHDAAYRIAKKNKDVEWIMYNVDQMTFNLSISPKEAEAFRKKETAYSALVKKIINVEGIDEEYISNHFEPYKNIPKISVPLPNLKPDEANFLKRNDNPKTVLRYFGRFYEDIRNPDCLIRMLKNLDAALYSAEFYGQSCEYLKKHYDSLPECVHLSGTVSAEKCIELTDSADILINVGNTCANQMPSKVFEYISSGKPILNIYFNDKELAMKYLKKYPCIMNVRSDENISSSQLDDFCKNSRLIPAEEIKEIFSGALNENVIKKSVEFIEE